MKTLLGFALILGLAADGHALFGLGKKKDEEPSKTEAAPPAEDKRPVLPAADELPAEKPAETVDKMDVKTAPSGMPTEVVIKGDNSNKLTVSKPPITLDIDPYESIRPSLKPDESMLLAVSPLTVSWRRTHPEFLFADRVIQPWRTTFSPKAGIVFRPRDQLSDTLQRRLDPKEAKTYGWSLTIADEEGRVFHHFEGSSDPPEEQVWSGQNDQGEWIHAGRSYSAVYTFTDQGGSPRTSVAKPLLFKGIVHQEDSGLHISLDSSVLFGSSKTGSEVLEGTGVDLLRSASDLIKRKFTGIPISLRVFASSKELGESQGLAVMNKLIKELMLSASNISVNAARASYSEQRVEIVLLNR
jgi:hypothetical protein